MLDLINVSLQFGGDYLYRNVSLKINKLDRFCLVGANGTGKSSLLKLINGELLPESGDISRKKNLRIGYLPQDNVAHKGKLLLEEVLSGLSEIKTLRERETVIHKLLENPGLAKEDEQVLLEELGDIQHRLIDLDSYSAESRAEKILKGLGFSEDEFSKPCEEFSGGWQMRIALAKILLSKNEILLMDEPTNHLDLESLAWLVSFLKSFEGGLIVVSHDRYFVNQVTNKTLEIYLNKFNVFNGNYDAYLKFKDERDRQTEAQYIQQQKFLKEKQRFIERFRYKSSKARQVQSVIKQLDKIDLIELPDDQNQIKFKFPVPPPSGKTVMELKGIRFSYPDKPIFKDFDFTVSRGEKIAFVGPNGAGKTTLAKILAGKLDVQGGDRIEGYNVSVSHFAQDVYDDLDPELDIMDTIYSVSEGLTIPQVRALLGCFLFTGDDVFKKVGVLSGGEKSRIALIKILLQKSNFLIFDEPTNHLDFASKQILQNALLEFTGTIIIVSHDIDFLKAVVNRVVEINRTGVKDYPGDFDYYLFKKSLISEPSASAGMSESNTQSAEKQVNRKDVKRLEAELRRQKYKETKDLSTKLQNLEEKIHISEKIISDFEAEFAHGEIYNNPDTAREKTTLYNNEKIRLDELMLEWEEISSKLDVIEAAYKEKFDALG